MNDYVNQNPVFTEIKGVKGGDLIRWSHEIAKGMEYLGSKCVIIKYKQPCLFRKPLYYE